ncbi:hypothetical protein P7C71_g1844, partial [Lecanoromycetidae sp. Uapishka_2]
MTTPSSRESSTNRTKASPAPSTATAGSTSSTKDSTTTSLPDAYVSDKSDDSSKLRTFLGILRKFIGVSDIASVRFSLPAQLLEPTPNLEYWNYLDRPETFIAYAILIASEFETHSLINLQPLFPIPKIIPPLDKQLPNESQRFWANVTKAIKSKQYNEATRLKTELEERQREKASQRQNNNEEWKPRFFTHAVKADGRPDLTDSGRTALKGLQAEDYALTESEITGA